MATDTTRVVVGNDHPRRLVFSGLAPRIAFLSEGGRLRHLHALLALQVPATEFPEPE
jgi:hypothetical protein